MAEMRIKTFYLPALTSTSNKSLYFETSAQRNKFFDNIGVGRSYTYPYDVYIKDLDELVQTITLTGIDKDFVDTYAEIKDPDRSVERFYYYITDKKEIGNNTWEITLLLDTVTTYLGAGNSVGFNLTKNAIVTRRHKTRSFDETPEPYDFPLYVKEIQTNDLGDNRVRLVYRNRPFDKKPVAYIHSETSKEVDVEPAALDYPVEWNYLGLMQNTAMATTKTRWKGGVIIKNTTMFKHHTITGVYQPNTHYALGVIQHVSADETHPVLLVLNDTDGSVVTSWSLRTELGVTQDIPQQFTIQPLTGEELFVNTFINGTISWADLTSTYTAANSGNSTGKKNTWTFQDIDIYEPMIHRVIEIPGFMGMDAFKSDLRGVYALIDTPLKQQVTWQNPRNPLTFDVSKVTKLRVPHNDKKLFSRQYMPSFYNHYGTSIECTLSDEGTLYSNVATPNRFSFKLDMPYFGSSYIHNMLTATDGDKLTYTTDNTVITLKDEAYTYDQYYKDIEDRLTKRSEAAEKRNAVINGIQTGLTLFTRSYGLTRAMAKPQIEFAPGKGGAGAIWEYEQEMAKYKRHLSTSGVTMATAAIGAGLSMMQGFMSAADTKKNNKDNLEIKLLGLLMSPTLTDGGDLDFNRDNNLDKPRIVTFGLLKEHLDFLDNVFHFTGYDTLEFMDLQAENFKTRRYFNYWQASLPIEGGNNYGFDDNIARDIVRRFENGVTIMHPQMDELNFYKVADLTAATNTYDSVDWNQEYENWEV